MQSKYLNLFCQINMRSKYGDDIDILELFFLILFFCMICELAGILLGFNLFIRGITDSLIRMMWLYYMIFLRLSLFQNCFRSNALNKPCNDSILSTTMRAPQEWYYREYVIRLVSHLTVNKLRMLKLFSLMLLALHQLFVCY